MERPVTSRAASHWLRKRRRGRCATKGAGCCGPTSVVLAQWRWLIVREGTWPSPHLDPLNAARARLVCNRLPVIFTALGGCAVSASLLRSFSVFSLCLLDKGSVLTPPKNAPLKAVAVLKMCANCSKDICSNAPKYWVYCLEKYTLYNHTIASPVTLAIRIFTSLYDIYVWALKLFFYKCPNYHQLISSCLHKKRELSHLLTHVYPCTQMHVLTMHTLGL